MAGPCIARTSHETGLAVQSGVCDAKAVDPVTTVLFLVFAVVVSGLLSRMLPAAFPRPLMQIAVGAAIGLVSHLRVELDPQIFFLVFLPPLLFLDGWRIPNDELHGNRATILELALGLVIFTVALAGLLIHAMIPSVPLPVAFALAAVLSPTDPIAVSAIATRVRVPRRMMRILEGEALLNDASGLVCLRFAVAAALTGTFSLFHAGLTFVWVALGGIALGSGIAWLIGWFQDWTSSRFGAESGSHILVSVLIPFAAYLAAESVHCSGILAAVAAGVTLSASVASQRTEATTRIRATAVWDVVQFAANGIIFVLLGEQLPEVIAGAVDTVEITGHRSPFWLLVYAVAIQAGLVLLRFVWVWVSLTLARLHRGGSMSRPSFRVVAAVSVAGVRGAVTLAGILTLPVAMGDGSPFPARALAICLAAGVIVLSLLLASLSLPRLLRGIELPASAPGGEEEARARVAAAEGAIARVQQSLRGFADGSEDAELALAAALRITDFYRSRIAEHLQGGEDKAQARRSNAVERRLRLLALEAEREEVFRRMRDRQLGDAAGQKLVRELDLLEARYRA
jgi:CPA1 family monovalent cation:H+ antiporter